MKQKVLAVDDDFLSRRFMELSLERAGYEVTCVESTSAAKLRIEQTGVEHFGCLIADYGVAGGNGLELLRWLKDLDPSLATIVVTAEGDQRLVEETMRAGACDFLNKPFGSDHLRDHVVRAVNVTEHRRQLANIATAVEEVGRVHSWMIRSSAAAAAREVELISLPKHQAGGDFFSYYPLSETCTAALMTDVSGHDLKAAYIASYLQGMVRAMLELGAPLGQVFERSNNMLLGDWGAREDSVPASVSACSLVMDFSAGELQVSTCGAPLPVFTSEEGRSELLGEGTSYPMGWFPALEPDTVTRSLEPGHVMLWTDGICDLAEQLGVTAYAVASALTLSRNRQQSCRWVANAGDDVMTARVSLRAGKDAVEGDEGYYPVLVESYRKEDVHLIDVFQAFWNRNMLLVLPEIAEETLHDVLLCTREMVLNGLRHGCRAEQSTTLQIAVQPSSKVIRILVDDPGGGHEFSAEMHECECGDDMPDAHYGLIMVRHLSTRFITARKGASITMDFTNR